MMLKPVQKIRFNQQRGAWKSKYFKRVLYSAVGCAVLVVPVLSQCLKLSNLCVSFWVGWKIQILTTNGITDLLSDFTRKRNICLPLAKHKIFLEFCASVLTLHFLLSEISTHGQAVFVFSLVAAAFQCWAMFLICIFKCTVLCKEMKEHPQGFFPQP